MRLIDSKENIAKKETQVKKAIFSPQHNIFLRRRLKYLENVNHLSRSIDFIIFSSCFDWFSFRCKEIECNYNCIDLRCSMFVETDSDPFLIALYFLYIWSNGPERFLQVRK